MCLVSKQSSVRMPGVEDGTRCSGRSGQAIAWPSVAVLEHLRRIEAANLVLREPRGSVLCVSKEWCQMAFGLVWGTGGTRLGGGQLQFEPFLPAIYFTQHALDRIDSFFGEEWFATLLTYPRRQVVKN